jgi:hypothetical protein
MNNKFKLELYNSQGERYSIITGSADPEDIDAAVNYLLKLKEERYTDERRDC